ncbi:hypothetical protein REPUB_Repub04eG0166100 [Reevesia pubescens]
MKNLQILILTGCSKLKELPKGIGSMRSLKELYVDKIGVEKLPESIYRLQKLEKLSLDGCINMKQLPKCLGMHFSLKELHLNQSTLETLPDSVGSLENLEKLSLTSCESLTAIPVEQIAYSIQGLAYVVELETDGTSIQDLPSQIGALKLLEKLEIRNCSLL